MTLVSTMRLPRAQTLQDLILQVNKARNMVGKDALISITPAGEIKITSKNGINEVIIRF